MSPVLSLYRSEIGKKALMAVSGIVLFGFVLAHMLGNLKLYQGPEKLNAYAVWLREVGSPLLPAGGLLWIFRVVLLGAVGLHILAAVQLERSKHRARPIDYKERKVVEAGYAARTMRWGGVIVLLFVLYHLAHFTWGWRWAHQTFVVGDVYHNVVEGFRIWWVSGVYLVAQVALGFHLYHGLWSLFQSLGVDGFDTGRRRIALVFAWVVTLGNASFPLSVLTGIVR